MVILYTPLKRRTVAFTDRPTKAVKCIMKLTEIIEKNTIKNTDKIGKFTLMTFNIKLLAEFLVEI